MKTKFYASLTLFSLIVTACALFPPAKSFDQSLAYAYGTHTALLTATTNAVTLGSLSPEDAGQVLKISDQARTVLDLSRMTAAGGDITTAEGQLAMAMNILTELQTYVNSKVKK